MASNTLKLPSGWDMAFLARFQRDFKKGLAACLWRSQVKRLLQLDPKYTVENQGLIVRVWVG
jgi:hypothetical protein